MRSSHRRCAECCTKSLQGCIIGSTYSVVLVIQPGYILKVWWTGGWLRSTYSKQYSELCKICIQQQHSPTNGS